MFWFFAIAVVATFLLMRPSAKCHSLAVFVVIVLRVRKLLVPRFKECWRTVREERSTAVF